MQANPREYLHATRLYADRKVCIDFLYALYNFVKAETDDNENEMKALVKEFNRHGLVEDILMNTLEFERATTLYVNLENKLQPEVYCQHWYAKIHLQSSGEYPSWDKSNVNKRATINKRLVWFVFEFFSDDPHTQAVLGAFLAPLRNPTVVQTLPQQNNLQEQVHRKSDTA